MQENSTLFDTAKHHIHLALKVSNSKEDWHSVSGILDSGAPRTEFSDQFLMYAGFFNAGSGKKNLKPGLQTQKYGLIKLPSVTICGHTINNFEVFVSHFEKSWGIDALIGLDFFRQFRVTVDYRNGILVTLPYGVE